MVTTEIEEETFDQGEPIEVVTTTTATGTATTTTVITTTTVTIASEVAEVEVVEEVSLGEEDSNIEVIIIKFNVSDAVSLVTLRDYAQPNFHQIRETARGIISRPNS